MSFVQKLFRDETGATSIEYGLIIALLALVSVPSFEAFGSNLYVAMNKVAFAECQASETMCLMVEQN